MKRVALYCKVLATDSRAKKISPKNNASIDHHIISDESEYKK